MGFNEEPMGEEESLQMALVTQGDERSFLGGHFMSLTLSSRTFFSPLWHSLCKPGLTDGFPHITSAFWGLRSGGGKRRLDNAGTGEYAFWGAACDFFLCPRVLGSRTGAGTGKRS